MKKSILKYLLLFFLIVPAIGHSQEDVQMEEEGSVQKRESSINAQEDSPIPPEDKKEEKKKEKEAKIKKRDKTPSLIAEHKKDKIQRYFKVGETIKYQTKTDKKVIKGTLEEINPDKVIIDGKEVKVAELILLGKTFGRTMGWRMYQRV